MRLLRTGDRARPISDAGHARDKALALVRCRCMLRCFDILYLLLRYQPGPGTWDTPAEKVPAVQLWWNHLVRPPLHPTPCSSAVVAWALTAVGTPGSDGWALWGAGVGGPTGDIVAVALAGRFLLAENYPAAGCRQGLPGSLLPSPDCCPAGCPNGTLGNLPLPLLPRLEEKAKPTMTSHPGLSPGCPFSLPPWQPACRIPGEGRAQPGEALP